MAILQSPGTDVTVINETFFIPAQATTVPVIFGVTAEYKFQSNGIDVAQGTTQSNKIRAITSVAQSMNLYGTPRFYRDSLGRDLHGDSRNEYGLACLNYVLGITALCYFIRADVNTDDTRANLLNIWQRLVLDSEFGIPPVNDSIDDAQTKIENDATALLNSINLANGWGIGHPNHRVSLTYAEIKPLFRAALDATVHKFYSFREKTVLNGLVAVDDPTVTVWNSSPGTYPSGVYVYYAPSTSYYISTGPTIATDVPAPPTWTATAYPTVGTKVYHTGTAAYYISVAAAISTDVPGAAPSVWALSSQPWSPITISWKNTRKIFFDDKTAQPFKVYGGPAGFFGLPTDTFVGLDGYLLDWVASTSGSTVGHEKEFTPLEAKALLGSVSDDFLLTKEFEASASLGVDDGARRLAIQTALQKAVLAVPELYGESITYTLVIAPGFPELVDDLALLYSNTNSETATLADGPMNMSPEDYVAWAAASSASGLTLPSSRVLPAGYPSRFRGDHYYYYGCGVITNVAGTDIVVPASVIGLRTICYSDLITYPWMAPAGLPNGQVVGVSRIGYLEGDLGSATTFVDAPLTQGDRNQFAAQKVNAIPFIDGSGYVVFSQTTSAAVDSELSSINVDRCVKYIKRGLRKNSKPFLFKPNDQITRDQFKAFVDGFLSELVTLRALYDFATLCDKSNNTPERVAKKEMWCEVAIQPITAVEFIYIPLTVKKPS